VLVEADAATLDEILAAFDQAEAIRLLGNIHLDSVRNGSDGLALEEIDTEIAAACKNKATNIK
jgi:hypothetical protein